MASEKEYGFSYVLSFGGGGGGCAPNVFFTIFFFFESKSKSFLCKKCRAWKKIQDRRSTRLTD